MIKTNKIFIQQWLELKPYEKQTTTDGYYLKLSNEIKRAIMNSKNSSVLYIYLDESEINLFACFLTSWFEDLVSGTNIWNTFTKVHKRWYGKPVPFYEAEEYYDEEINLIDVYFLIWYFLNTIQKEKYIAPINDFIFDVSANVMDVFDEAWEYAPENKNLNAFYSIDENEKDFYIARKLIETLLFKTYLFFPDTAVDLNESNIEIVESYRTDQNLMAYINENQDAFLHRTHTKLLALTGKEWAAELLGNSHPLSHEFRNMSEKIRSYFLYKGQDSQDVFLEHIATGKKFNLTKKSYDNAKNLKETDTILFMGIVKWMDEWWFSGINVQSEYKSEVVLHEKKSQESKNQVKFLDYNHKKASGMLDSQKKIFMKINHNEPIVFLETSQMDPFIKDYFYQYNKSILDANPNIDKEKQFTGNEENHQGIESPNDSNEGLIFFNPKSGLELAFGFNSAFPATNNPFYKEEDSEDHAMELFFDDSISKELVLYCIENYKDSVKFFQSSRGKIFLDNADFLLRYYKTKNYFSKPAISFTETE